MREFQKGEKIEMSMYKTETRTVINLLQEGPPSIITVKRAIILLMRLDSQIDSLYKELNETAKEKYINGRNDGIREFAERLKLFAITKFDWNECVDIEDVGKLMKEMTEE